MFLQGAFDVLCMPRLAITIVLHSESLGYNVFLREYLVEQLELDQACGSDLDKTNSTSICGFNVKI